ncbi:hypothetical protein B0H13DRAFT_1902478 [Mycena leptocephala]|nr:hypothetical protein B0H13DRAFT_1902478 [Mycena leptocephala]
MCLLESQRPQWPALTCGPRELLGGLPALASVNETKEQRVGTSQSLKKVKKTLNRKTRAARMQGTKEAVPESQRIKHQSAHMSSLKSKRPRVKKTRARKGPQASTIQGQPMCMQNKKEPLSLAPPNVRDSEATRAKHVCTSQEKCVPEPKRLGRERLPQASTTQGKPMKEPPSLAHLGDPTKCVCASPKQARTRLNTRACAQGEKASESRTLGDVRLEGKSREICACEFKRKLCLSLFDSGIGGSSTIAHGVCFLRVVFSGSARLKVQGDKGLGLLVGKKMWAGGCHECVEWQGREQRTKEQN